MAQVNLAKVTTANNAPVGKLGIFVTPDNEAFLIDENGAVYAFGGGATSFLALSDVIPANYTGASLQAVRVNAGETGLEFVAFPQGFDGNPSSLNQEGATNGQAIVWNGAIWAPASVAADITAGVGLSKIGTEIKLGDGATRRYVLTGTDLYDAVITTFADHVVQDSLYNTDGETDKTLDIQSNTYRIITASLLVGTTGQLQNRFQDIATGNEFSFNVAGSFGSVSALITDDINLRGVEYGADYSANFTDRSLIDKAYVDAAVGTASQLVTNQVFNFVTNTVTLDFIPDDMLYVGLNGQLTDEWTRVGDQLTVTNFVSGFIIVGYYKAIVVGSIPDLQEVTTVGNATTLTIQHADGLEPNESATVGQLNTAIDSINQGLPNGIISGGIVVWLLDYDFDVSEATLRENGIVYIIPESSFTIAAADPTNPRKDTVVVSSAGFEVLEGTPAPVPVEPQPTGSQIRLSVIDIPALSTEPSGVTLTNVYLENVEYVVTHSGAGTSDPDDLLFPFAGVKAVNVSSVQNGSSTIFTAPGDLDRNNFTSLSLRLRLKEAFNGGHNLTIRFLNNADVVVSTASLVVDKLLVDNYQLVALSFDALSWSSDTFRKLSVTFVRSGNQTSRQGYFIDNFIMQGGLVVPPVEGAGTVTSVAVTGTDGIEVDSGSPITGAGTITLGLNADAIRGFSEATLLEANAISFDKDYIIGNAGARTGNITFDFTGAKLGATVVMRHQDALAFTIPTEAKTLSGTYDGAVDNYFWFVITDKTAATEIVQLTISQIQP